MSNEQRRENVEAILNVMRAAFPGWECDEWPWPDLRRHVFAARKRGVGTEHRLVVDKDFIDDSTKDAILARLERSRALEHMREHSDRSFYVGEAGESWIRWTQHGND